MKRYLVTIAATLGLAAFGLLASSCAGTSGGSTHQMGPPGKTHPMPDENMPSRAGKY